MSDTPKPRLKISREGIVLIKSFEGFRPRAIRREDGGWVIGYGHTLSAREGALLVPSADPHLSEYLPGYWQGRQWLSGFHGSVGTLIVTADFAGVWADSRYWEQATKELKGSGIELVKLQPGQPGPLEWLAEQTPEGGVVAVDGAVMAVASARTLGAGASAPSIPGSSAWFRTRLLLRPSKDPAQPLLNGTSFRISIQHSEQCSD